MNTAEWMLTHKIDKWTIYAEQQRQQVFQCQNCYKNILYGVHIHGCYVCEECTGKVIGFACTTQDCDPRPFYVTQSTLDEAGGWIACEVCGKECEGVEDTNV